MLSIDDLTDDDVRSVMSAASSPPPGRPISGSPMTVGLLFLTPSLRTRLGFSVAAARLGGSSHEVVERRVTVGTSAPETFADTLRTISGMVDIVVVRVPFRLSREALSELAVCPLVNGGDAVEHPTQALIDLFAIERERGPVGNLRMGVCGDLRSRTARSLLKLLGRFPPRELTLVAPPGREDRDAVLGPLLESRTRRQPDLDVRELDVLYLPGLPEGAVGARLSSLERERYSLTEERAVHLPEDAVVLSPMPVIDEIANTVRRDRRIGIFRQNDAGVAVRVAVLERMMAGEASSAGATRRA